MSFQSITNKYMTDRQGQDINDNLFLILVHKPLTPPPF